jgi:hypothetical protein
LPETISDEIIIEVVAKAINSIGKNSSQMLWSILENDYGITKNKIPENLPALMDALQKIFGLGYNFIDLLFRTLLQQFTGESFENKSFIQCVIELQNNANSKSQKENNEILTIQCYPIADELQKNSSG